MRWGEARWFCERGRGGGREGEIVGETEKGDRDRKRAVGENKSRGSPDQNQDTQQRHDRCHRNAPGRGTHQLCSPIRFQRQGWAPCFLPAKGHQLQPPRCPDGRAPCTPPRARPSGLPETWAELDGKLQDRRCEAGGEGGRRKARRGVTKGPRHSEGLHQSGSSCVPSQLI